MLAFTFLKVNQRNTRKRCELCQKLTIKTQFTPFSSVSIVGFEPINVSWVTYLRCQSKPSFWTLNISSVIVRESNCSNATVKTLGQFPWIV